MTLASDSESIFLQDPLLIEDVKQEDLRKDLDIDIGKHINKIHQHYDDQLLDTNESNLDNEPVSKTDHKNRIPVVKLTRPRRNIKRIVYRDEDYEEDTPMVKPAFSKRETMLPYMYFYCWKCKKVVPFTQHKKTLLKCFPRVCQACKSPVGFVCRKCNTIFKTRTFIYKHIAEKCYKEQENETVTNQIQNDEPPVMSRWFNIQQNKEIFSSLGVFCSSCNIPLKRDDIIYFRGDPYTCKICSTRLKIICSGCKSEFKSRSGAQMHARYFCRKIKKQTRKCPKCGKRVNNLYYHIKRTCPKKNQTL